MKKMEIHQIVGTEDCLDSTTVVLKFWRWIRTKLWNEYKDRFYPYKKLEATAGFLAFVRASIWFNYTE